MTIFRGCFVVKVIDMNALNRKEIDKKIYIPYGLEIETENIPYDDGKRVLRHKVDEGWDIGTDRTLINGGLELTSPVLPNNKETIIRLKKISKTLEFLNPTFDNASLQINFKADYFTNDDIINLLKMFSIYENIICRFCTGVNNSMRKSISGYASPLGGLFRYNYNTNAIKEESYVRLKNNKSLALSLKTLTENIKDSIKVIEFRTPNGTDNFYLWMNYIIFFSSFLTIIKNRKYDEEYINYLFYRESFAKTINDLVSVDEKKATEFANLIYQSEAEKECFYSQYFDKKIRTR